MRIRAVTLWEPWATLMALCLKKFETRSWYHQYRGPLAVHASKRWRPDQEYYLQQEPYASALAEAGYRSKDDFALGCVLSVGDLVGIYATEKLRPKLEQMELAFGNYMDGRKAWHFKNMRQLPKPVPARGAQGLWFWDVPADLVKKLGL